MRREDILHEYFNECSTDNIKAAFGKNWKMKISAGRRITVYVSNSFSPTTPIKNELKSMIYSLWEARQENMLFAWKIVQSVELY